MEQARKAPASAGIPARAEPSGGVVRLLNLGLGCNHNRGFAPHGRAVTELELDYVFAFRGEVEFRGGRFLIFCDPYAAARYVDFTRALEQFGREERPPKGIRESLAHRLTRRSNIVLEESVRRRAAEAAFAAPH